MQRQAETIPGAKRRAVARPWLAVFAGGVFAAGCVSTQPIKTLVRQSSGFGAATPTNVDSMGVLVDGEVDYDSMTGLFIDIADSRTAISELSKQTDSALAAKGYAVDFTETPFVGGWLDKLPFQVVQDRHGDPAPRVPPFDAGDTADPSYQTALRDVSRGLVEGFANVVLRDDTRKWSQAARDGLAEISAKKHIRYLLVVQGHGRIESGWKQATVGIGMAALTTLATMGTVTATALKVSWLDSYVMLIDLQNSNVLWSNAVRLSSFDPGNPEDYDKNDWSRQVFYYLPSRGNAEKVSAK